MQHAQWIVIAVPVGTLASATVATVLLSIFFNVPIILCALWIGTFLFLCTFVSCMRHFNIDRIQPITHITMQTHPMHPMHPYPMPPMQSAKDVKAPLETIVVEHPDGTLHLSQKQLSQSNTNTDTIPIQSN